MKCEGLEFQSLGERLRFFVSFMEIIRIFFSPVEQSKRTMSFFFIYIHMINGMILCII